MRQENFTSICRRLTGQEQYKIVKEHRRDVGKLFFLETDKRIFYITYTPYGNVDGRNSYFQSIPTAMNLYLENKDISHKETSFHLYLPKSAGNNKTSYHIFMYQLLKTIGIDFINEIEALGNIQLTGFTSVEKVIGDRNKISSGNRSNRPTFITDEGDVYNLYAKTFGANSKESSLICLAISRISDKPINLYFVEDNKSNFLSKSDIKGIQTFAKTQKCQPINFYSGDGIDLTKSNKENSKENDNLRHPQFTYNLLAKTYGKKKCVLCNCMIERIIQAAHIYPLEAIKKDTHKQFSEKLKLAVDGNNGMWLCQNHHKLFDCGLIRFNDDGSIFYNNVTKEEDKVYLDSITIKKSIGADFFNSATLRYLHMRDTYYAAQHRY